MITFSAFDQSTAARRQPRQARFRTSPPFLAAITLALAAPAFGGDFFCAIAPDRTLCADTDGNECTVARCNQGVCDQSLPAPADTHCDDNDGNPCMTRNQCDGAGACVPSTGTTFFNAPCPELWDGNECTEPFCCNTFECLGQCGRPKASGTPCADDGNECTTNFCNSSGTCGVPVTEGTPCDDHDGNVCSSRNACDASGNCVLSNGIAFFGGPCPDQWDGNECTEPFCCNTFACQGQCGRPKPTTTPCTHDGNECTTPFCNANGTCGVPKLVNTPCDDNDGNVCSSRNACDASGNCVPFNGIAFFGGPCPDQWDGNECTEPFCCNTFACQGQCGRPKPTTTPCTDDGNECTTPFCNTSGTCGIPKPASFHCDDHDANVCMTRNACDGSGTCVPSTGTTFFGGPCPDGDDDPCTEGRCGFMTSELGQCIIGPAECDDGDECTIAIGCDPVSGCLFVPTLCLDDGDPCTTEACDPSLGCVSSPTICPDTDDNNCTEPGCNETVGCDQSATCTDTTPPLIDCPEDVQVICGDATDPSATGAATADDEGCDPDPVVDHSDEVTGATEPADPIQEVIERTWTATDDCDLIAECTQTIEVFKLEAFLDIKPGSCPNPLTPQAAGVVSMSVLGTFDFDVKEVDPQSLLLSRADGVGATVSPIRWSLQDTATPYTGSLCGCHRRTGDRIVDLSLTFDNQTMVTALQLNDVPVGASIELVLSGSIYDGCQFIAADCMLRNRIKGQ